LDSRPPSPVLVLGLGNPLLRDDGVGLAILESLRRQPGEEGSGAEFLDGGTQGLNLLACLEGRRTLILLDALQLGKEPGAVSVLDARQVAEIGAPRAATAHEGNAGELLAAAALLGELPEQVFLVGIEPQKLTAGVGLSPLVEAAVPEAAARARELITGAARGLGSLHV